MRGETLSLTEMRLYKDGKTKDILNDVKRFMQLLSTKAKVKNEETNGNKTR
jgi:hypothetical protein